MRSFAGIVWVALMLASAPAGAQIEEFDDGFGDWQYAPQRIGGGEVEGWAIVSNAGERAARTSPTGTQSAYYWKLQRDLDLSTLRRPALVARWHFKGHAYASARIEIGPEGATRLGQFTPLVVRTAAGELPEDLTIDLSPWAGQRVRLRFLLEKPWGVTERRIGLYVHRAGVVEAAPPPVPVRVGAFNVQVFGRTKASDPVVLGRIAQILARYDAVVVQEIRDATGTAFPLLLDAVNAIAGGAYTATVSDRLGRTRSKEQYAVLFRRDLLALRWTYHFDDGDEPDADLFEREPFVVGLETIDGRVPFVLVPLHAAPSAAVAEIDALGAVHEELVTDVGEPDVLLLGDLNADCRYVSDEDWASISIRHDPRLLWLIGDDADTTTTPSTDCAYDRVVAGGTLARPERAIEPGVFRFDLELGLDEAETLAISDHYPVEVTLMLSPDSTVGLGSAIQQR